MGQGFLVDTNAVIDTLNNSLPPNGRVFVASLPVLISEITHIELLGWPNASPLQLAPVNNFISHATLLSIDRAVVLKTIEIRQTQKIKLGDAIIAATALIHNLTLITRNTEDFSFIQGLSLINPHSL